MINSESSELKQIVCGFYVGQPSVLKPAGFPQQLLLVIQQEKECIDKDLCNDSFKKKRCWKSNRTVLGDSSVCHSVLLEEAECLATICLSCMLTKFMCFIIQTVCNASE